MKTTHLFVELIIIGIGTAIWLCTFIYIFYDLDIAFIKYLFGKSEIIWGIISISIIYSLGIFTDRFADALFSNKANKIREKIYTEKADVLKDKVVIYKNVSPLVDMIDYGRSRMRVCRGWVVNLLLIAISGNLLLAVTPNIKAVSFILLNLFLIMAIIGFYFAWRNLTKSEYEKIKAVSSILKG